jgi:TolB-like protein
MENILIELKRRHVFRNIAGYGVVAWLAMQLAAALETSLHLPNWFDTIVTVLALIGFPIVIAMSWAFQFTKSGVIKTPPALNNENSGQIHNTNLSLIVYSLTTALTITMLFFIWQHLVNKKVFKQDSLPNTLTKVESPIEQAKNQEALQRVSDENQINSVTEQDEIPEFISIAVMPFEDFSPEDDQGYFGKGLAEQILNLLSKTDNLRVVSRASSFSFDGTGSSVQEISRALNTDYIIEGSVRKAGNIVRVTAQLINSSDDSHIWSDTYDRQLSVSNLFDIQSEITLAIVDALKLKTSLGDYSNDMNTLSLDSYSLFLKGRDKSYRSVSEDLSIAIDSLNQVIAQYPNFAPAYAHLGEAYLTKLYIASDPNEIEQLFDQAESAIGKANQIASTSAPVLTVLSRFIELSFFDEPRRFKNAESYVRAAIDKDANYMRAYSQLASILNTQNYYHESQFLLEEALSIDPLSYSLIHRMFDAQIGLRNFLFAEELAIRLSEIEPDNPETLQNLVELNQAWGDYSVAHSYAMDLYSMNPTIQTKFNLNYIYDVLDIKNNAKEYSQLTSTKISLGLKPREIKSIDTLLESQEASSSQWPINYLSRNYELALSQNQLELEKENIWTSPIRSPSVASTLLINTILRKKLDLDISKHLKRLDNYYKPKFDVDQMDTMELSSRMRLAYLKDQPAELYNWSMHIVNRGIIEINLDEPIFDDYQESAEFQQIKDRVQSIKKQHQKAIEKQLQKPKENWISFEG